MDRRTFIGTLTGSLLVAQLAAEAQQAGRVWRIGVLIPASADANPQYRDAFVQGLREHGLIDGKNIALEWRFADGKYERLPALARNSYASKWMSLLRIRRLAYVLRYKPPPAYPSSWPSLAIRWQWALRRACPGLEELSREAPSLHPTSAPSNLNCCIRYLRNGPALRY